MSEKTPLDRDMAADRPGIGTSSKTVIGLLPHVGSISAWLGLLGLLIVFVYSAQTGFFPKGLSTADSIVFIFSLLAFGIVVTVGVLYGAFALLWLFVIWDEINAARIARWRRDGQDEDRRPGGFRLIPALRRRPLAFMSFFVCAFFGVSLLIASETSPDRFGLLWQFVQGYFVAGFLVMFTFVEPLFTDKQTDKQPQIQPAQRVAIFGIAIIALFVFGSIDQIMATTMRMVGVRHERAPIELSASNFARVLALSTAAEAKLVSCPLPGTENVLLFDADLLWYGVGAKALLRLNDPKGTLSVEIDDSGVWPLHAKKLSPACKNTGQRSQPSNGRASNGGK